MFKFYNIITLILILTKNRILLHHIPDLFATDCFPGGLI